MCITERLQQAYDSWPLRTSSWLRSASPYRSSLSWTCSPSRSKHSRSASRSLRILSSLHLEGTVFDLNVWSVHLKALFYGVWSSLLISWRAFVCSQDWTFPFQSPSSALSVSSKSSHLCRSHTAPSNRIVSASQSQLLKNAV